MGIKPLESVHGLGKWYADWKIASRNRVNLFSLLFVKSVPFTKKRPERPETGIKDGLEESQKWNTFTNLPF